MAKILIIDDDPDFSHLLERALKDCGHQVHSAQHAQRGLDILAEDAFDVVLLDNRMPAVSGIELLETFDQRGISTPVVLMTSHATTDSAIQAMNRGAFDYVIKPLQISDLVVELEPLIAKSLDIVGGMRQCARLPSESGVEASWSDELLLGNSRPMQEVYKLIGRVSSGDTPVLIRGETGVGKELVARAIHAHGARKSAPFVAINCSALNEQLLDDELFGHEPGAFTGATKLRKGRFEYAHAGTLFLDEVGDMPPPLQAKLLRVLETQEVSRIGSNESIQVDVRLVSATHRDLETAVAGGSFREDLFYRLNGVMIHVPPLRKRTDDLRVLAEHFLATASAEAGSRMPSVEPAAWDKLRGYRWPGNVRQLQNVMRRAMLVCRGQITPADIDFGTLRNTSEHVEQAGENVSRSERAAHEFGPPEPAAEEVHHREKTAMGAGKRESPGDEASQSDLTGEGVRGSEAADQEVSEMEALAGLQTAVRWALGTGRNDLHPLLHEMLNRELVRLALAAMDGNQTRVAKRLGIARNTVHARMQAYDLT